MKQTVMIKAVIAALLLGLFTFSYQTVLEANTFEVKCKSKIYMIEDGTTKELDGNDTNLQQGDTLRFSFWLSSESGDVPVKIIFNELTGVDSFSSIIVNGDRLENTKSIDSYLLTGNEVRIDVEGIYSGIDISNIKSELSVTSLDNKQDGNHSFGFSYFSMQSPIVQSKKYTVNFYGVHSTIIESKQVEKNETVIEPKYELVGYDVLGFNEKTDGSGDYFNNGFIGKDSDWFVVVKPKEFVVSYYVDGELYKASKLFYNEDAFYIEPPQKEGYEFVEWFGNLHNIKNNVSLHAVYKHIETQEYYISEQAEAIEMEENYISTIDYKKIKSDKKTNQGKSLEEYYISVSKGEDISYVNNSDLLVQVETALKGGLKSPLGIGLFLLLILLIIIFFYKIVTKSKRLKSNL
ncbi:hypothetical protein [Breznakia pachnodae]|uniref:Uncharacterized protein n=1 Tax=Breznakia pachnodae TaxID=265178 RepID=A0ABU0E3A9_9FIRM|nr:hypothetical protein [Breznakia pachnodae]MDQ0361383.1 hypothetical protein [Breznakia pachnodae]